MSNLNKVSCLKRQDNMAYYVLLEYSVNVSYSMQTFYLTALIGKVICRHQVLRDILENALDDFSYLHVRRYQKVFAEIKMRKEKLDLLRKYHFQFLDMYNGVLVKDITDTIGPYLLTIPHESEISIRIGRYNIVPEWENASLIFRF